MTQNNANVYIRANDKTQKAFDQFHRRVTRQTAALNNAGNAAKKANRSHRQFRGGLSMMSYQIQDVAVQLQGGQNALLIFTQQGSQMASAFGPGGIVLGAILAVGGALAGALAPQLMKNTSLMEAIKERTDDVSKSFVGFKDNTDILSSSMEKLYNKTKAGFFVELQNDVYQSEKAITDLKTEIVDLTEVSGGKELLLLKGAADQLENSEAAIVKLKDQYINLTDEAAKALLDKRYENAVISLSQSLGVSEDAARNLGQAYTELTVSGNVTAEEYQKVIDSFGLQSEKANELAVSLRPLTNDWENHNAAIANAKKLLDELEQPTFEQPAGSSDKDENNTGEGITWRLDSQLTLLEQYGKKQQKIREESAEWFKELTTVNLDDFTDDDALKRMDEEREKSRKENFNRSVGYAQSYTNILGGFLNQQASARSQNAQRELSEIKDVNSKAYKSRYNNAKRAFALEKKQKLITIAMLTAVGALKAAFEAPPGFKTAAFGEAIAMGASQAAAVASTQFNAAAPGSGSGPSSLNNATSGFSQSSSLPVSNSNSEGSGGRVDLYVHTIGNSEGLAQAIADLIDDDKIKVSEVITGAI